MKKSAVILILSITLLLGGCQSNADFETQNEEEAGMEALKGQKEDGAETGEDEKGKKDEWKEEMPSEQSGNMEAVRVVQDGPYGQISLSLPEGWSYEVCPVDSDSLMSGIYGLHFYPEGAAEGYIEVAYTDSFGVCGTGLSSEETALAGCRASIGTYDNHEYWDFISFQEECEGVVALTYWVDGWWEEYGGAVLGILDTLSFDKTIREGGVYVYGEESAAAEIALELSLKKVSATGAILVFDQYDRKAPTGELEFGANYTIERLEGGEWEELPGPVEGSESENYAFTNIAYLIEPEAKREQEVDWEWLHGPLPPGEYRIKKNVHDFRGTGDFDEYTLYARFVLN